ncbi:hypothetical protein R3P38DRAFT_3215991 [Favolaschia claudopus]|uniref:Uncharacterized protein n=1 Tax=Favolaschia claudopus TaxID=2862362 RepID=A0AAW0A919_9AGAR
MYQLPAQASNAASSSSALPTSLTGDSSDEPREIAANQKAAATAVADPQPRPGDFTAQYLRFIFLLKGTDTAVKVDKNVTAADALANYRVIEASLWMLSCVSGENGYLCPADYSTLRLAPEHVCYAVLDTHTLTSLPISSIPIPYPSPTPYMSQMKPFVPADNPNPNLAPSGDEKFPASINPWLSTNPYISKPHTTYYTMDTISLLSPSYSYLYRNPAKLII